MLKNIIPWSVGKHRRKHYLTNYSKLFTGQDYPYILKYNAINNYFEIFYIIYKLNVNKKLIGHTYTTYKIFCPLIRKLEAKV
jgi:hypothetical protein